MSRPHEDPNCKCAACEAWENEERLIRAAQLAGEQGSECLMPNPWEKLATLLQDMGVKRVERTGVGQFVLYWE
jgi:hypothetical protein